ncbi:MAG: type II toxin-antitoxin system RatA family toxin [Gammaproteobacteria bacterium]|nr:type II toxin-antitoxin system RatA family toxin [Gammaproteobacteria bacterium]MBU1655823.1 type II toxin-antitoxin system RatA family toxin [Gammaproteobacteria bacterium]MBU1960215.1 type II toxin-antitoxin system RatA family toxin [Gammaproteobacteria bacterium]
MTTIYKTALVPFSAARMYGLVNDVESYPAFLPWCSDGRLVSASEGELCGEIEVSRMGVRQRFTTCNRLIENQRIEIGLKKGPFKRLDGVWLFTPLRDDACKVELTLNFEFSGGLIDRAFGTVFNQIAITLVDAFCKRAGELYGD